jgi:hypothetical protein
MCAVNPVTETCRSVSGESVEESATVVILKGMIEQMKTTNQELRKTIRKRDVEIENLYLVIEQWKRNCKEK